MEKKHSEPSDPIQWDEAQVLIKTLMEKKKYKIALYISAGIYSGLRISDMKKISKEHFLSWKIILCEGKTKKYREINISEGFKKIIEICCPNIKDEIPINFSPQYYNQVLKRLKAKYKINCEHISNHSLRKTFALKVWENYGKSDEGLIVLSQILNHSNTAMTRLYLGINRQVIKNVYLSL